jgi:uncharacterized protein
MAASYKTPGVYVEEIPKFPPSIAAVETAIPAFVGYTEKATRNGESLLDKPIRIESIAEYEEYFGGGPSQDVTIAIDSSNNFISAMGDSPFFLYDSLRMFYANGGGKCYILSIGDYDSSVSAADLADALDHLELEDEPTIILAPDAVSDVVGLYDFQKQALTQCNKLMDRVVICDLRAAATNTDFRNMVNDFRNNIGINHLKYGAAYGPWIRANLPRNLQRRNIGLERSGSAVQLSSLTTDTDIQSLIADLIQVETEVDNARLAEGTLSGSPTLSLEDRLMQLIDDYNGSPIADENDAEELLQPITEFAVAIILAVQARFNAAPPSLGNRFKLQDDITNYIANAGMIGSTETVAIHHNRTINLADAFDLLNTGTPDLNNAAVFLGTTQANLLALAVPANVVAAYTSASVAADAAVALGPVLSFVNEAIAFFRFMQAAQRSYEKALNESLLASFGAYKNFVTKAAEALNLLPPSGTIAGVYAATDRDRGVWKAPANVSLNSVIEPAVKISHEQQGEYNVDVNAGKSVNIIRAFTGKGVLVWGARTLAGNDNEWRYVSVRRFFNFVEESVKKATEQFVFDPNDANTWVKVQAMIENFLTTLWRQGALQGIKPEHAFYVAVGLGKTMTPLDILEGRMIIEIGMAAVRPAEFIILKFSHKMAES